MSKNYDMIATVDIDIVSPMIDDASFDNLLIVGPLPKAVPESAPPKVGAYSSLDEVTAAGWVASGDDADPVGAAAAVAFSQSPTPNVIYIAPIQHTAAAVKAAESEAEISHFATENIGTNAALTGCTIEKDTSKRVIAVNLTGDLSSVKGTGFFVTVKDLVDAGYTVTVDGVTITSVNDFLASEDYSALSAMGLGDEPVQMSVSLSKDGVEIDYGIVVGYPAASQTAYTVDSYNKAPIAVPESEVEDAVATLQRAVGTSGWYVACPVGVDRSEYEKMAAYVETQEKMLAYTELGFFNAGSDAEDAPSVGKVYYRTLGVYGRESSSQADGNIPPANQYINVAFVARWLGFASGSETTAFKTLTAVYPSELTTTEMKALEASNVNYFITVGSKNLTMNGKVLAGEWADIIRFRDWLKNDMQLRVVNLFAVNPKIPYTDSGIALVQNQMMASLKAGQDAGGIAEEEFDEDGNSIPGYQTSVPRASSITAAEKASRKLSNCKFKARLAGAIHFAELKGSLTYEL